MSQRIQVVQGVGGREGVEPVVEAVRVDGGLDRPHHTTGNVAERLAEQTAQRRLAGFDLRLRPARPLASFHQYVCYRLSHFHHLLAKFYVPHGLLQCLLDPGMLALAPVMVNQAPHVVQ
jgi:hypothetical protein